MPGTGRLLALLIIVAVLACAPATETDLIGTWTLTNESRERLPEEFRNSAGTLVLAEDGTFMAFELPVSVNVWASTGDPSSVKEQSTNLTGSGDWTLRQAAVGNDTVVLSIKTVSDVSEVFTGDLSFGYALSVRWAFSGYTLVDYWGDPDAVPGIFFARAEAEQEP